MKAYAGKKTLGCVGLENNWTVSKKAVWQHRVHWHWIEISCLPCRERDEIQICFMRLIVRRAESA